MRVPHPCYHTRCAAIASAIGRIHQRRANGRGYITATTVMRIERRLAQHLKSLSTIVRVSKGTRLFTQGEPANQACVIEMGRVRLWLADDQGNPIWSRIVGSGAVLGLPSSISGRAYSLTAVALESVHVAFVGRDVLQEVITTNPKVSTAVLRILSEELSQLR